MHQPWDVAVVLVAAQVVVVNPNRIPLPEQDIGYHGQQVGSLHHSEALRRRTVSRQNQSVYFN